MPHQPDERYVHLHTFAVPCAVHGSHRYALAGLDHAADDAAFYLLRTLRRNRIECDYDHLEIPLDRAKEAFADVSLDLEDLPF